MSINPKTIGNFIVMLAITVCVTLHAATPLYKIADAPVEARVSDLLGRMTLREKIGQLNQRSYWYSNEGRDLFFPMVASGEVGSLMNVVDPNTADELQHTAIEMSRLGIPLLFARDIIHGYKTIFPIPLGIASTFSPEIAALGARIAAIEGSSDGIRWTFAPMIDISRDARWGRIAESFGEDPYLTSEMARASVRGFQNADSVGSPTSLAACAKHFVAYGAAEGGLDYNLTDVSERTLRQTYFPPFIAASDAGVMTFMSSFNANNGVPSSSDRHLLTEILRDEWGFRGFVVSDCFSVRELLTHRVAVNESEAAAKCITAGVDMDMEDGIYAAFLEDLVNSGAIGEDVIDRAVSRVLRTKFMLGLFENPYVSTPQNVKYAKVHLDAACDAARKSAILLKNDNNILPLDFSACRRLLVTGPLADADYDQLGTWIFDGDKDYTVTILDAFRDFADDSIEIIYEPGLKTPRSESPESIAKAVAAAREADAIVVVVGEEAILTGEAHSMADIKLVGGQSQLVDSLAGTGKPLIMIVMAGRPLAIAREADLADAVLYSFHPGTMGGPAIVDILAGRESPSGRAPVSFPRTSGQCPVYYNHPSTGRPATGTEMLIGDIPEEAGNTFLGGTTYYLDAGSEPLYPFGYGLTYGQFVYSDLSLDNNFYTVEDTITATFTLKNIGRREAEEVVQLYTTDEVASVTPSVTDLRRFSRVRLAPGEEQRIVMTLPVSELAVVGRDLISRVESGAFRLRIGPDSKHGISVLFQVNEP